MQHLCLKKTASMNESYKCQYNNNEVNSKCNYYFSLFKKKQNVIAVCIDCNAFVLYKLYMRLCNFIHIIVKS